MDGDTLYDRDFYAWANEQASGPSKVTKPLRVRRGS